MSAQSNVERDARRHATTWLLVARGRREDRRAFDLLDDAANSLAVRAARAVLRGDMPEARRYATAHQLVTDSRDRLAARKSRERAAENAAKEAAHGISAGDDVRITSRLCHAGAVGDVVRIDDVDGDILWTTVDGDRRVVWAHDAERVEAPMPHDDEHGGDPAEPPYGDRILALGLWSDSEAFELAGVANAAAREGRDPGPAVQDRVMAWDAGEVSE